MPLKGLHPFLFILKQNLGFPFACLVLFWASFPSLGLVTFDPDPSINLGGKKGLVGLVGVGVINEEGEGRGP